MASSTSEWKPKRSYEEVDRLLCAKGGLLEIEKKVIRGQVQRVYKNLPPSVRAFALSILEAHSTKTCIVFEQERLTYGEVKERAIKAAAVLHDDFGVAKGDRVAICSRNFPEYVIVFWAIHLIGAVPVLVNAWLPVEPLVDCLKRTNNKVAFVDPERAKLLQSALPKLKTNGCRFIVLQGHEGKGPYPGVESWSDLLKKYCGDSSKILKNDPKIGPEDNGLLMFTSGSTGLPKAVLLSQRAFLTIIGNAVAPRGRCMLLRGEDFPQPPAEGPQQGLLLPTPLFHTTGTSLIIMAAIGGMKLVLMRKWDVKEAVRLFKTENIQAAGGVPSTIVDLVENGAAGLPLQSVMLGGAPVSAAMSQSAKKAFPGALMAQAYGQSECGSTAVGFTGEDFEAHPTSCGRLMPVNDILIMKNDVECAAGEAGEIWIRGPNVMTEYWGDPVATAKTVTKDGWLKTGDVGYVDTEGYVYIKDRIKDIIIRGGENVDSVMVENALYRDPRVFEAAAVGVPDHRLGELVVGLVTLKPSYRGKGEVTEAHLSELVKKHLPRFAIPVMILVLDGDFVHTPSEKIVKTELRKIAATEWEKRKASGEVPVGGKL